MKEQYLWNRSGEPDPEVAELENLLEPFRYKPTPEISHRVTKGMRVGRHSYFTWWVGIAAATTIVAVIVSGVWRIAAPDRNERSIWKMSSNGATPHAVRTGQTIETGHSGVRLESEFIGEVNVAPSSRLHIMRATREEQRLALERGTIHAFIWA